MTGSLVQQRKMSMRSNRGSIAILALGLFTMKAFSVTATRAVVPARGKFRPYRHFLAVAIKPKTFRVIRTFLIQI